MQVAPDTQSMTTLDLPNANGTSDTYVDSAFFCRVCLKEEFWHVQFPFISNNLWEQFAAQRENLKKRRPAPQRRYGYRPSSAPSRGPQKVTEQKVSVQITQPQPTPWASERWNIRRRRSGRWALQPITVRKGLRLSPSVRRRRKLQVREYSTISVIGCRSEHWIDYFWRRGRHRFVQRKDLQSWRPYRHYH